MSALLFVAMAIYTSPLEPSIPVIQLTFTEAAFQSVMNAWRPEDVVRFKYHFAVDFPFLLCYGAFGYAASTRTRLLRCFSERTRSMLALVLPVGAAADAVENALHLYFVLGTGPLTPGLYLAAGAAASLKWLLIAVFVGCTAYALRRNAG